jgi:GT2 family glycosyltransferase
VLCYAIGNEIPASIVRWHGRTRVERYLERLYHAAKLEDPGALVTYVNYPSTEYLELPFVDLVCFNVYLEARDRLEAYLARLQSIAGDRPLLLAELGLCSRQHGELVQARTLDWQVRTAFAGGCAGAFVFAWTDEWHRGGHDVEEWCFGVTRRDRRPKPALLSVRRALADAPFPKDQAWPRISVVVCTYNGARTIADCCAGLQRLEYPNYEVLIVDDGSTDATAEIAARYGFRVISTPNRGLGSARNTGLAAASGDIIAYTDDDARPDPHWLTYLAATFARTPHAGVGGPNIPPPGDGPIAECVANAPGGPVHVLLDDVQAEHIPGCNMAFRTRSLEAIGGFDRRFRTAGDDVDVCWRIQQQGWTLGFSPGAMVWHHRRNSLRDYWKQQKGYGRAEALLEQKWPEKYNTAGHLAWAGRLYGRGLTKRLGMRQRIYHGTWGTAPFQSLYETRPPTWASLPLMPEWYLVAAFLMGLSALSLLWSPLRLALAPAALALALPILQALSSAASASFPTPPGIRGRALTAFLHLMQPLARLIGRWRHGLTPWRRREWAAAANPWPRTVTVWSERWRSGDERLHALETTLKDTGVGVVRGGDYDRWDLEVRVGAAGAARTRMVVEEHGHGRQLLRFRVWGRASRTPIGLAILLAVLAAGAVHDGAWTAALTLIAGSALATLRVLEDAAAATGLMLHAIAREIVAEEDSRAVRTPDQPVAGSATAAESG